MFSLRRNAAPAGKFKITGSYQLERYDENLEPWLTGMRIEGGPEVGKRFRDTRLKIMVKEPSKHNKKWSLIHKDEGGTNEAVTYDFEPGKTLVAEGQEGATERITCASQGDDHTLIICKTEVKDKDWTVETRIKFRPDGLTCIVTNKSKPENGSKFPSSAATTMSMDFKKLVDPWTQRKSKMLKLKHI